MEVAAPFLRMASTSSIAFRVCGSAGTGRRLAVCATSEIRGRQSLPSRGRGGRALSWSRRRRSCGSDAERRGPRKLAVGNAWRLGKENITTVIRKGAPNRLAAAWCNGRRCKGEHAEQERRPAAGGAAAPDGGGGRSSGGTVKPAEKERRVRACRCAAVRLGRMVLPGKSGAAVAGVFFTWWLCFLHLDLGCWAVFDGGKQKY
uniref:Uncharacterized protein n=1 Tax=Setaria viridis TaxID=4556 RepID=A0A4U6VTD0_SETVI|nr:hypothetical protein SEVIR_2G151400v2 [Setaria viridis]